MRQERWVRENVLTNPERGRRIAEIRKEIRMKIEKNRAEEVLAKVSVIKDAKNPQGEIFKIRRGRKKVEKTGFPLKDAKGNMQVSKEGIDRVILAHFDKVFSQNPVPDGYIWSDYWKMVDEDLHLTVHYQIKSNQIKSKVFFLNSSPIYNIYLGNKYCK